MEEFLLSPMIAWPDYQEESEQFYDSFYWGAPFDEVYLNVDRFRCDDRPVSRVDVGTQTEKVRCRTGLTAHKLKCSMMMHKDLK